MLGNIYRISAQLTQTRPWARISENGEPQAQGQSHYGGRVGTGERSEFWQSQPTLAGDDSQAGRAAGGNVHHVTTGAHTTKL